MKEKITTFQMVIMVIFGILFFVGFIAFSTYKPAQKANEIKVGSVKIWGTLDQNLVNRLLRKIKESDERFKDVVYIEKSKSSYNHDILEALASGNSPDLLLSSNNDILVNRNKIFPIPNKNLPVRAYLNTFADAFDIYVAKDGVLGIPFIIDPMVMYYNKSLFASSGVVLPPKKWEEFEDPKGITEKIRVLDDNDNILKTAIAFGEAMNVKHYKEILNTLFLQKGNRVVIEDKNVYKADKDMFEKSAPVIKFYTEFANEANKITYSWNKSMNDSETEFLAGNLGTYFGFTSEIKKLRLKNPNLNFDVAEIPSFSDTENKTVFARTWVFSIPKAAKNKIGALETAKKLASKEVQEILAKKLYLPPVRKDLLNITPDDAFMDVFYREAIYATSIFDPDYNKTNDLYREYITNVNTGLKQPYDATRSLSSELNFLLANYKF